MATSLLDFVSGIALAAAPTAKYGTKATLVTGDRLYISDSADSNQAKLATLASIKTLVDSSITAGTLATAAANRTVQMNGFNLIFNNALDFRIVGLGTTLVQNATGLKIHGGISGVGKLRLADSNDSHAATITVPTDVTANYEMKLLPSLPGVTSLLTISATGQLATTAIITSTAGFRGGHDASGGIYPEVGGAEPPEIRSGDQILAGDHFDIAVAGTLGVTAVDKLDSLYAIVDTPGQTPGNWGIITSPVGATDTNITTGTVGAASTTRTIDFGNQNLTFDNAASQTFNSTAAVTFASNSGILVKGPAGGTPGKLVLNDGDDSTAITLQAAATTNSSFSVSLFTDPVAAGTEMVTLDNTGQLATQAIPAGGTDTHIFLDSLADQAAAATHVQAGFVVGFNQSTANSGMKWTGTGTGTGVKDGTFRVIGADGDWWTVGVTTLGEHTSTTTGTSVFE